MSYHEIPTDAEVADADDLWNARGIEVGDFLSACEVKEVPITEWLKATVGVHMKVPHVMREKVVTLKALPPQEWSIAA